ncbi:MAG TPA: DNA recombination protein RmuC [Candidatus Acidoferrales bacterium]|nr:DNA recombination protein RmuC [Candidatus Acidoferrales bacterium]
MTAMAMLAAAMAALVGAAIGWLLGGARARTAAEARLREFIAGRASAESAAAELRKQAEGLRGELASAQQQLQREQTARASAETALAKAQENLAEQRQQFEEARAKLVETFQAAASQVLAENNTRFLELARTRLETLQKESAGDLSQRQTAIAGLVEPMKQALESLRQYVGQEEASRRQDYGALTAQVQLLNETSRALREETGSLVTSLRQPQIKGKWGELTLRRAAELTGMSPHCDFEEQVSAATEEGRLRPDMVVRLPGGGSIIVDAKVPLHAFLTAVQAKTADEYRAAMSEHSRLVRKHIQDLAAKKYPEQFEETVRFVVLFLPGESFFSAAVEQDRELLEYANDRRVILASPTTFLALLHAVAQGWQQEKLAENAREIAERGKELHERLLKFLEYLDDVRVGLDRANSSYNKAVSSLESRLLPAARRFQSLAAPGGEEVSAPPPVDTLPRQISVSSEGED